MNIDQRIALKEQEMRDNRTLLNKYSLLHPKGQGEAVYFNTPKDVLFISLYSSIEERLGLEHELLLNEKDPKVMRIDVPGVKSKIQDLEQKISTTQIQIDKES